MHAGWEYFHNFPLTAKDFAVLAKTKLAMPVLVISGEKAGGKGLGEQLKLVAGNVTPVVLEDTGHWVIDERPAQVLEVLQKFLSGAPQLRTSVSRSCSPRAWPMPSPRPWPSCG